MDKYFPVKKRFKAVWIYLACAILALSVVFIVWLLCFKNYRRTNDAYVQGNKIVLTPLVDGFITGIYSDDAFWVNEGQLLIDLDPADYQLAYEKAASEYGDVIRQVCSIYHQVFAYQNEIEIKEAAWVKAQEFYNHRLEVLSKGAISLEDFQASEATLQEAYFDYVRTQNLYQGEAAKIIGRSIYTNPRVQKAREACQQAWINLLRTQLFAPNEGLIAQRDAQVGMWVSAGTPLLSVIPLDQIWVNANFKETQMRDMKIGQKVELTADMYGSKVKYEGVIVGLPGGAGNAFSILPPQNLSGNWIKIVQRLPVRVQLNPDQLKSHPLRIGMTMRAKVDVKNAKGSYFPGPKECSPTYDTPVFNTEMSQAAHQVQTLFKENVDPSLSAYIDEPFYPE